MNPDEFVNRLIYVHIDLQVHANMQVGGNCTLFLEQDCYVVQKKRVYKTDTVINLRCYGNDMNGNTMYGYDIHEP